MGTLRKQRHKVAHGVACCLYRWVDEVGSISVPATAVQIRSEHVRCVRCCAVSVPYLSQPGDFRVISIFPVIDIA